MQKKLKVLLVFDSPYSKDKDYDFVEEFKDPDWSAEDGVYKALKNLGHEVSVLGLFNDIRMLIDVVKERKPDIVFNLTEVFHQRSHLDKNVVWILEMLNVAYTGASADSLLICNNKGLSKKILSFHRIKVPRFYVYYRSHKIRISRKLKMPVIVKPLCEEASRGISQASVVDSLEALIKRVEFIHQSMKMDVIVEEYIDGREFYVSILGNKKIKMLPLREVKFGKFTDEEYRVATYKAKWDMEYRKKWGIKNVFAGKLAEGLEKKIEDTCKKAYKVMNMKCYARFDIRVTENNEVYIIEANANPSIDKHDELAQSADKSGIPFEKLIEKILVFGLNRNN